VLENANCRDNQNDAKANLEHGSRYNADHQPADDCPMTEPALIGATVSAKSRRSLNAPRLA
jgi:hypothetical protein